LKADRNMQRRDSLFSVHIESGCLPPQIVNFNKDARL
jgi:hypothetical protein